MTPCATCPREELDQARADEPVGRYRARLIADGVLDEEGAAAIDEAARTEVEQAFTEALAAELPDGHEAFVDVYGTARA